MLIHSPAEGCLDCFQFEAIINKVATNVYIKIFELM